MKFTFDLAQIAELPTQIATSTALRVAEYRATTFPKW